jgi:hypothetical protein
MSTDSEFIWLPRDEKVPEPERHTIPSKRFMLTILWNLRWFYFIKVLEKGRKFNCPYYTADILSPLSEWRSIEVDGKEQKLIMQPDNARPHGAHVSFQFFEENRMKPASYPPYSPDLGPADFYLFGYVKGCLTGLSFEGAKQFLEAIQAVLDGIEKVTLQAVFLEWMDRFRKYIAANGEYTN